MARATMRPHIVVPEDLVSRSTNWSGSAPAAGSSSRPPKTSWPANAGLNIIKAAAGDLATSPPPVGTAARPAQRGSGAPAHATASARRLLEETG